MYSASGSFSSTLCLWDLSMLLLVMTGCSFSSLYRILPIISFKRSGSTLTCSSLGDCYNFQNNFLQCWPSKGIPVSLEVQLSFSLKILVILPLFYCLDGSYGKHQTWLLLSTKMHWEMVFFQKHPNFLCTTHFNSQIFFETHPEIW